MSTRREAKSSNPRSPRSGWVQRFSQQAIRSLRAAVKGEGSIPRWQRISFWSTLIAGSAIGLGGFQLLTLWLHTVGLGGVRTMALLAGSMAGLMVASAIPLRASWQRVLGGCVALELAVMLQIPFASWFWNASCQWASSFSTGAAAPACLAAVCIVFPCCVLAGLVVKLLHDDRPAASLSWVAAVSAIALSVAVFGFAGWVSLIAIQLSLLLVTLAVCGLAMAGVIRPAVADGAAGELSAAEASLIQTLDPLPAGDDAAATSAHGISALENALKNVLSGVVTGAAAVLVFGIGRELAPVTPEIILAVLAGWFAALPCAAILCRLSSLRVPFIILCWTAAGILPGVLFPEIVLGVLQTNLHVSNSTLLLAIRFAGMAGLQACIGCGFMLAISGVGAARWDRRGLIAASAGFFMGAAGVLASFQTGLAMATLLVPLMFAIAGAAALCFVQTRHWRRQRARMSFAAVAVLLIGMTWWGAPRANPATSARLLFSTDVLQAVFQGERADVLPYLDEGRVVLQQQTGAGSLTVWKYRGVQYHVRTAGIPHSVVSYDPRIVPEYSAEILPALFGLALHRDPQRVCLLGSSSGVPVQTALAFPVREVVCLESSQARLTMLLQSVWGTMESSPLTDERFEYRHADPTIALRTDPDRYDVIVMTDGMSSTVGNANQWTAEFFELCRQRLTDEGLFCVRFRQIDYGAAPLQTVVRTLQSCFAQTAALEIAPGEIMLIGSNGAAPVADQQIVDRASRAHVQHVLSRVGWDWVKLLQLPYYTHEALQDLAGDGPINRVADGRFAYQVSHEMLRWGPKQLELEQALAPRRGNLLAFTNPGHHLAGEIANRINELRAQNLLLKHFPDEPWAYRKKLKEFLQTQPRTQVQQVAGGESAPRHPVDRQRIGYLRALSQATKSRTAEDIRRLSAFEYPHDPLLTFFMHREIAELYERSPQRDPEVELSHRLHAIYFADPADTSVRDVAEAIQLLVDFPDVVPDGRSRLDHLNALFQTMKRRWDLRQQLTPESAEVTLNDISISLDAIRNGYVCIEQLASQGVASDEVWDPRREYLDRHLVRPLRTYRGRLLPHQRRELYKREKEQRTHEKAESDPVRTAE